MIINIKPLSVNKCWQGKRFKTREYEIYERDLLFLLPMVKIPPPPYELHLEFGFSSPASDFDNPVKPFVDILTKRYSFNDKLIKKAIITVQKTVKGQEFIRWDIFTLK